MPMSDPRPGADVVVPFAGDPRAFAALLERLGGLDLGPADTVVVVDNRREGDLPAAPAPVRVIAARSQPGSYFARNRGAEQGSNPWLVFIDADVEPPRSLVDDYLGGAAVPDGAGVLVGDVVDEPPAARPSLAVRYAHGKALMSQAATLRRPEFAYAQTANCAVRREAFDAVNGFVEEIRSGGDADLCFRIRAAGWQIVPWPSARVTHRSRTTLRALLRQRVRVGAGARWLEQQHPGFAPRRPLHRAVAGGALRAVRGAAGMAAGRGDAAVVQMVDGLADAAFQIGWRLPNRITSPPPTPDRSAR